MMSGISCTSEVENNFGRMVQVGIARIMIMVASIIMNI